MIFHHIYRARRLVQAMTMQTTIFHAIYRSGQDLLIETSDQELAEVIVRAEGPGPYVIHQVDAVEVQRLEALGTRRIVALPEGGAGH